MFLYFECFISFCVRWFICGIGFPINLEIANKNITIIKIYEAFVYQQKKANQYFAYLHCSGYKNKMKT